VKGVLPRLELRSVEPRDELHGAGHRGQTDIVHVVSLRPLPAACESDQVSADRMVRKGMTLLRGTPYHPEA
jgi:hypothetical protein